MSKATVIVGSAYGDESKGVMTDYLVRKNNIQTVVRFNGGAQAGHTVQVDQTRHVFGHLGAGSFAGADTYFSSDFIINPFAFKQEYKKFIEAEVKNMSDRELIQHVHSDCIVTTIYDMAINSLVELNRGSSAHGSCGMGINETVTRSEHMQYKITAYDTFSKTIILQKLTLIKSEWIPKRAKDLNLSLDYNDWVNNERFSTNQTSLIRSLLNILNTVDVNLIALELIENSYHFIIKRYTKFPDKHFVFEGAQGLMLDEELGVFPHVTRSLTGLPNAIKAAFELGVIELQPLYVMRAYTTRHGNGPLDYEQEINLPPDLTNRPNQWQGTLRFGLLNLPKIKEFIQKDLARSLPMAKGIKINTPELSISCLDQAENFNVVTSAGIKEVKSIDLRELVQAELGYVVRYTSHGPTAETVVQYDHDKN